MDLRDKPREGKRQAGTDRTGTRSRASSEDQPLYMRILLAIPKNLVYIFAGIIVFAFLAMLWITYSDQDMQKFMKYDRTKEVVVVHPLYSVLQDEINLDRKEVSVVKESQLNLQKFNIDYVTANRPVVLKGMASDWGALKNWQDPETLGSKMGEAFMSMNRIGKMPKESYSTYKMKTQKTPQKYKQAFTQMTKSWESQNQTVDPNGPPAARGATMLFYIEDEPFRGLRSDYSFPMLQKFLRLQRTSWSWYPNILERKPLQAFGENVQCVVQGKEQYRLISPVFKQNLYTDVFEDLSKGEIPDDISFFKKIPDQYPLLIEAQDYILSAELNAGDCIYIPDHWWFQSNTIENVCLLNFEYEQHSKLADLFFQAVDYGVLEKD